jgi:hypothetical protein
MLPENQRRKHAEQPDLPGPGDEEAAVRRRLAHPVPSSLNPTDPDEGPEGYSGAAGESGWQQDAYRQAKGARPHACVSPSPASTVHAKPGRHPEAYLSEQQQPSGTD